jgi:hypothetical protein
MGRLGRGMEILIHRKTGWTDRTVDECVGESTDNSKTRETRPLGVSTYSYSASPGYDFNQETRPLSQISSVSPNTEITA